MTARAADEEQIRLDREAAERGSAPVQDIPEQERILLLGYLAGAVSRLADDSRFALGDRAAARRVAEFFGHFEDMAGDERIYLLGYLAGAVLRLLPNYPVGQFDTRS